MSYDSTQDDRLWAMLSYVLGIVTWFIGPLILFLVKKDSSKFVGFHAMQGLIMYGALSVLWVGTSVLSGILGLLAAPLWFLAPVASLAVFIFAIIGAIKSYAGEWYEVPLVGKMARQQVGV